MPVLCGEADDIFALLFLGQKQTTLRTRRTPQATGMAYGQKICRAVHTSRRHFSSRVLGARADDSCTSRLRTGSSEWFEATETDQQAKRNRPNEANNQTKRKKDGCSSREATLTQPVKCDCLRQSQKVDSRTK
ncbi:hypothetical protein BaRGS_00030308 [Batillaria attramentaria]|uniref:Uncharacterized protein n=1 Tax=Batillaria attramentaria TaxID=370345 RepID=A0ABD0JTV0_9CAEN